MTELQTLYVTRFNTVLLPVAERLAEILQDTLGTVRGVSRIATRAKSIDSFLGKADRTHSDGAPKYATPLEDILDQIGALVIVRFLTDVGEVEEIVKANFKGIEQQYRAPESDVEFGYEGLHFVRFLPTDIVAEHDE